MFGDNIDDWAFVCPACGKISKGIEFKMAGAKQNDIYSTCIGRHNSVNATRNADGSIIKGYGCNWAAYGLLSTLGKGDIVVTENGEEVEVFKFAEKEDGGGK